MLYRREIDGLRAVAVLGVLLFHSGLPILSGGFLGVDIFFVISGYLLSSLILSELKSDTFLLRTFYFRRAKRIIPALVVVVGISTLLAWHLLLPEQLKDYANSLLGIALMIPNIWFWKQTGYFSAHNEEKPLIHTWSLGIEEQFYVLFPLLLIWIHRWTLRKKWGFLILIFILSLGLADWSAQKMPSANFYLLPGRVWEFVLGALIALTESEKKVIEWIRAHRKSAESIAFFSLLCLMGSMIVFSERTPHPSRFTLIPTISVALILLLSDLRSWTGKLLSSKPFVQIGLLSYSLYLWHQPVFAFMRIRFAGEHLFFQLILNFIFIFVLSFLTWLFIEQPFRKAHQIKGWGGQVAIVSLSLLLLGIAGVRNEGFPQRMRNQKLKTLSNHLEDNKSFPIPLSNVQAYRVGQLKKPSGLAFLGDSHANYLLDALSEQLKTRNTSAIVITESFCAPLIQFGTDSPERNPGCKTSMSRAIEWVLAQREIKTVVLFAEWAAYTEGFRWTAPKPVSYSESLAPNLDIKKNPEIFSSALKRTVQLLLDSGKKVMIIKGTPEYQVDILTHFKQAILWDSSLALPNHKILTQTQYVRRNINAEQAFNQLKKETVRFVEPGQIFCPQMECEYISEGKEPYYMDDNHLSKVGAHKLLDAFWSAYSF
ncbi:acyltransferase [bacterium]|nr:acyltransferase [bacterium]